MSKQSANAVVMIRPSRFYPNPETSLDNSFQQEVTAESFDSLTAQARAEFDEAVRTLSAAGVKVHVFDDTPTPEKPDAVFPNNWFSTHHDGRIALYPMYTPSRRAERRPDLIASLQQQYRVSGIVDYSPSEEHGLYLEGTGSLVLDHENRIAYVSLSRRADQELVGKFCADFDYEPVIFQSSGDDGRPIYHTNVMLCVGTQFALVGLKTIDDPRTARDRCAAALPRPARPSSPSIATRSPTSPGTRSSCKMAAKSCSFFLPAPLPISQPHSVRRSSASPGSSRFRFPQSSWPAAAPVACWRRSICPSVRQRPTSLIRMLARPIIKGFPPLAGAARNMAREVLLPLDANGEIRPHWRKIQAEEKICCPGAGAAHQRIAQTEDSSRGESRHARRAITSRCGEPDGKDTEIASRRAPSLGAKTTAQRLEPGRRDLVRPTIHRPANLRAYQ